MDTVLANYRRVLATDFPLFISASTQSIKRNQSSPWDPILTMSRAPCALQSPSFTIPVLLQRKFEEGFVLVDPDSDQNSVSYCYHPAPNACNVIGEPTRQRGGEGLWSHMAKPAFWTHVFAL